MNEKKNKKQKKQKNIELIKVFTINSSLLFLLSF